MKLSHLLLLGLIGSSAACLGGFKPYAGPAIEEEAVLEEVQEEPVPDYIPPSDADAKPASDSEYVAEEADNGGGPDDTVIEEAGDDDYPDPTEAQPTEAPDSKEEKSKSEDYEEPPKRSKPKSESKGKSGGEEKPATTAAPASPGSGVADKRTVDFCIKLFSILDVYDLAGIKPQNYACLPPECIEAYADIQKRMPSSMKPLVGTYSAKEMDQCCGQVFNDIKCRKHLGYGPPYLDIIPLMPDEGWKKVDKRTMECLPWQSIVANMDPSVWGTISPEAFNKFPSEFWENAPMDVLQEISPGAWCKMDAHPFQVIRPAFMRQLPWEEISLCQKNSRTLNAMHPKTMGILPWEKMMPKLGPAAFTRLSPTTLKSIPSEAWEFVSPAQVRAISPGYFSRMPEDSLATIPLPVFKGLPRSFLQAMDPAALRAATGGALP